MRETFNVLAETTAGRDDNVVMLGAHLDSVTEGAGINDNGSGSAGILEVAIQLAKVKKLNNTVRFAWWGAEELGLIGSYEYVESLSEAELGNIATYLNFDMIASPNYIIGVYDADQSTYEAPVPVPDGSVATEAVFTDYFDSIEQPWVDTEFSGRSDYQAFILAGVPASGLFTGADGVKTEERALRRDRGDHLRPELPHPRGRHQQRRRRGAGDHEQGHRPRHDHARLRHLGDQRQDRARQVRLRRQEL